LFNALTQTQSAQASNFPFCTIEPNVARVIVPDSRLQKLALIANSKKTIPLSLELHDIAGLIKGASKGEGLGNKFLGHVRQASVLVHVLRCFINPDILHVSADDSGRSNPLEDLEVIETELLLSDIDAIDRRLIQKRLLPDTHIKILNELSSSMQQGVSAKDVLSGLKSSDPTLEVLLRDLNQQLLSAKPVLFLCNVDESSVKGNELTEMVKSAAMSRSTQPPAIVCGTLEEEALTLFDLDVDRQEYLSSFGLSETGLDQVVRGCADLLGQDVFYTVGEQEARSWSIPKGTNARDAAGKIHTDMSKGFIAAEAIAYDDFISCGGEAQSKKEGKSRSEGRDYIVQNGDIMHFKFN